LYSNILQYEPREIRNAISPQRTTPKSPEEKIHDAVESAMTEYRDEHEKGETTSTLLPVAVDEYPHPYSLHHDNSRLVHTHGTDVRPSPSEDTPVTEISQHKIGRVGSVSVSARSDGYWELTSSDTTCLVPFGAENEEKHSHAVRLGDFSELDVSSEICEDEEMVAETQVYERFAALHLIDLLCRPKWNESHLEDGYDLEEDSFLQQLSETEGRHVSLAKFVRSIPDVIKGDVWWGETVWESSSFGSMGRSKYLLDCLSCRLVGNEWTVDVRDNSDALMSVSLLYSPKDIERTQWVKHQDTIQMDFFERSPTEQSGSSLTWALSHPEIGQREFFSLGLALGSLDAWKQDVAEIVDEIADFEREFGRGEEQSEVLTEFDGIGLSTASNFAKSYGTYADFLQSNMENSQLPHQFDGTFADLKEKVRTRISR
jgi:hypothetical protein